MLDCFSHVWLWQCLIRPNWGPWGILVVVTVNFALSVSGYLSVKRQIPGLEGLTKAVLIVNGINVAFQAGVVAHVGFILPKVYEPLVRPSNATPWWNWGSSRLATQGMELGQIPSQFRDSSQLDSLYHVQERIRKDRGGKLSRTFTPVSRLRGFSIQVVHPPGLTEQLADQELRRTTIPPIPRLLGQDQIMELCRLDNSSLYYLYIDLLYIGHSTNGRNCKYISNL